ncbi:hypothetical protein BD779DRAFT_1561319 [Infundibulicybe gibba]|nr:hypothetical protein BD779DRAFT_1561319 [Infundibulicybe gibba]
MALTKIPLLLSAAWGMRMAVVPPQSPPPADERLKPIGSELLVPFLPLMVKALFIAPQLIEAAVIFAHEQPNNAMARAVLHYLTPASGAPLCLRVAPVFQLGWTTALVGVGIRLASYQRLGRLFTYEISVRTGHRLITTGPYAVVRHPSYTGFLLICIGGPVCALTHGSWLAECCGTGRLLGALACGAASIFLGVLGIIVVRARKEDGLLEAKFGKEWRAWAAQVRYLLLPGVY